jgi:DivIVA domain-containing protein
MAVLGRGSRRSHDCAEHGPLMPEDVLGKLFRVHRLAVGYDPEEVDDFLDAVAASMAGFTEPLTGWDIRQHEFQNKKRFGAFPPEDVDEFLECIARTLEGSTGAPPLVEG